MAKRGFEESNRDNPLTAHLTAIDLPTVDERDLYLTRRCIYDLKRGQEWREPLTHVVLTPASADRIVPHTIVARRDPFEGRENVPHYYDVELRFPMTAVLHISQMTSAIAAIGQVALDYVSPLNVEVRYVEGGQRLAVWFRIYSQHLPPHYSTVGVTHTCYRLTSTEDEDRFF